METPEATGENEAAPALQTLHMKGEFCTLCVCVFMSHRRTLKQALVGEIASLECKNNTFSG